MSNNGNLKEDILYNLRRGQQNAIKKAKLAGLCGIHERGLRLAIRELIDEGYPICGSPTPPHGYFLASSTAEINDELELLKGYGKELFRRYSTLKKIRASFILQHPGQMGLGI